MTEHLLNHRPESALGLDNVERSLREQAQSTIREAILSGRFTAGQKLTERQLTELTGSSRSILREALSHLEARGLLIRQTHRGFTVAKLNPRAIYEIFELREPVETLAAELFTERASDQEVAEIKAAFEALEHSFEAGDLRKMRTAKEWFFSVLFTGCRNTEIRKALENVIDRISYLRIQLLNDSERRKQALIEMGQLANALVARDRDAARNASIAHLVSARQALIKQLSKSN